jgi:predicted nucleic acid-binding protein
MKHLLDVNVQLASVWITHPQHATATAWLAGKTVVVCPISELGFLRISTHKKAFNFTMADARTGLENFLNERSATRIPDDLPALDSKPAMSEQVTDHYLADLAAKHGLKLATLDAGIRHATVELVS